MNDDVTRLVRYIQLTIGVLWMSLSGGCALYFFSILGSQAIVVVLVFLPAGLAMGWAVARPAFRALMKSKDE
ncbi:MAG: hypothetical protein HOP13_06095 [Alphaproteobacteria bacterium]|nr:hypothetical protein [Alphaproteobacteria bacterium]